MLDPARQERFHRRPVFLPDGRHFLYVRVAGSLEGSGIYLGSLDLKPEAQSRERLLPGRIGAVFAATSDASAGYILFLDGNTLLAQAFDLRKLALVSEPVPIAERVGGNGATTGYFSASANGTLAYRRDSAAASRLVWFDRSGKSRGSTGEAGEYISVALSRDGKRLAVSRRDVRNGGIWVFDVERNAGTRFTFGNAAREARRGVPSGRATANISHLHEMPIFIESLQTEPEPKNSYGSPEK
jgi:hypothetical protein